MRLGSKATGFDGRSRNQDGSESKEDAAEVQDTPPEGRSSGTELWLPSLLRGLLRERSIRNATASVLLELLKRDQSALPSLFAAAQHLRVKAAELSEHKEGIEHDGGGESDATLGKLKPPDLLNPSVTLRALLTVLDTARR